MDEPVYYKKYIEICKDYNSEELFLSYLESLNEKEWIKIFEDISINKQWPVIISLLKTGDNIIEYYSIFLDKLNPRSTELIESAIRTLILKSLAEPSVKDNIIIIETLIYFSKILGWGVSQEIIANQILLNKKIPGKIKANAAIALATYNNPMPSDFWINKIDVKKCPEMALGKLIALKDSAPEDALQIFNSMDNPPKLEEYILSTSKLINNLLDVKNGAYILSKTLSEIPEWALEFINDILSDDGLKKKFELKNKEESKKLDIIKKIQRNVDTSTGEMVLTVLNKGYSQGECYAELVKNIISELMPQVAKGNTIKTKNRHPGPIKWDLIALYLLDGWFHFCSDPYFLTASRREMVGVVEIGYIDNITFFLSKRSDAYDELIKSKTLKLSLKDTLVNICSETNTKIGVLGDCVSTSIVHSLLSDKPGIDDKVEDKSDEILLRIWIDGNPKERIIVGDLGLVPMLMNVTEGDIRKDYRKVPKNFYKIERMDYQSAFNNDSAKIELEYRYPVGFVYPKNDLEWRDCIKKAIVSSIKNNIDTLIWDKEANGNGIVEELASVGVKVWPFKKLCEKYNMKDIYEVYKEKKAQRYMEQTESQLVEAGKMPASQGVRMNQSKSVH